ncbi:MAG: methylisocitrate lyase [SAR86 cluster bacterium]|nr:methylisocitrate lyase [SAR86 cluster bacterium]
MQNISPGSKLRNALEENHPLQLVGTTNAYSALLAEKTGHQAIYLSGGGVAASSLGIPDLGITTLNDVIVDVERITNVCDLPLIVDADVGWGGTFNLSRMTRTMIKSGAAGIHIEDQVSQKRCGHRPNKEIVSLSEMCDRVKSVVDAKTDDNFYVIARTDAIAVEGIDSAIERAKYCIEEGADAIFPEAVTKLEDYKMFKEAVDAPILANITEFGASPYLNCKELSGAGVDIVLYPLTAFRAMSKAAEEVYREIKEKGTQKGILDKLQTRDELYEVLDYHSFENKLDELFKKNS